MPSPKGKGPTPEAEAADGRQMRLVAVVIAATMLLWLGVQWIGGRMGWPGKYVFLADLAAISCPTLVVNGSLDVMLPTINSFHLQQHLPDAQLILYPDAGHAAQFQYPGLFLAHLLLFLDGH